MPPKRTATGKAKAKPPSTSTPKRASKLAKENSINATQEAEIQEAFSLFAVQHPDFEDSGVLRREDVRRCLIALGYPPPPSEIGEMLDTLDPTETGYIPYPPFLSYAALQFNHAERQASGSPEGSVYDEDERVDARQRHRTQEVKQAYELFARGTGPITLAHLKRVARELREEVAEEVLRDMLREANGSQGQGDGGTVGVEEFEAVMRRAGV
ncbi:EF-hand, partial [Patellaria atrata CBS 101060]